MNFYKSLSLALIVFLIGCGEDTEPVISNDLYLLDADSYEITGINLESNQETLIGTLEFPDWAFPDLYVNTNSNTFIDEETSTLTMGGWDLDSQKKYVLLFDYTTGELRDSIEINFPFSRRYFYSPKNNAILSFAFGSIHSKDLQNGAITERLVREIDCSPEHQGINNNENRFYNYGCNVTSLIDLETQNVRTVNDFENLDQWRLLFSIGVSENEDYLMGFGLYQRHFPEDPDFVGTFDSIRDELYLVKRNLLDGTFEEHRIDTEFGSNNGYYDVEQNMYYLQHNWQVLVYNSNLEEVEEIDLRNQFLIKK